MPAYEAPCRFCAKACMNSTAKYNSLGQLLSSGFCGMERGVVSFSASGAFSVFFGSDMLFA